MRVSPLFHCLAVIGLVAGAFGWAHVANAQVLDPETRALIALEETDRHIARAEIVLSGSENADAQRELGLATNIQAQARAKFTSREFRLAVDLTLRARLHADRAIALVKGLPDPDRVLIQLERTRELIDRARDRVEECHNDRAHAMLRAALEMQLRAEAAAQEGRHLAALQLTMGARERALRALRLCNLEENMKDSADRALKRTDEIIARAHDRVVESGVDQARVALRRAMDLQERAYAEFRSEHFEASLRLTQSARAFAYRAIRLSGGGGS